MYLDHTIAQYESLGLPPTSGCTDAEVLSLEQHMDQTLPAAYREFLGWAGHDAGPIFSDLEDYTYDRIPDMQALAHELIDAYQFQTPLPEDALVFYVYDNVHFAFIRSGDGDDPTVYHFVETPSTVTATFTSTDPNQPVVEHHISTGSVTPQRFIPEGPFSVWIGRYIEELAQEDGDGE
ncbi:MAG: SMI1/KNR4 family protein [Roseiflexaceae bacterium]